VVLPQYVRNSVQRTVNAQMIHLALVTGTVGTPLTGARLSVPNLADTFSILCTNLGSISWVLTTRRTSISWGSPNRGTHSDAHPWMF
jgi:hypothetical protein